MILLITPCCSTPIIKMTPGNSLEQVTLCEKKKNNGYNWTNIAQTGLFYAIQGKNMQPLIVIMVNTLVSHLKVEGVHYSKKYFLKTFIYTNCMHHQLLYSKILDILTTAFLHNSAMKMLGPNGFDVIYIKTSNAYFVLFMDLNE